MLARAYRYSVKILPFSVTGLKDEKFVKKQTYIKLKHANSILETFEYSCHISSKSIYTELYRFKFGAFFETQCISSAI